MLQAASAPGAGCPPAPAADCRRPSVPSKSLTSHVILCLQVTKSTSQCHVLCSRTKNAHVTACARGKAYSGSHVQRLRQQCIVMQQSLVICNATQIGKLQSCA
jgi:hypothetical protein